MRDAAFALAWVFLLPIGMFSAFIGTLLWVWVALLSPNELLYGFMAAVPLNKIVAIFTLLVLFVRRDKRDPYLDPMLLALLFFAISSTLSWLMALAPSIEGDDLYQKLIKEIVLAFVICTVMVDRLRIHLLVLTVVVALGFLAVKEGMISLVTAGAHKVLGSLSIGDNNSLATALLMSIPLNLYLARYSAVRLVRTGLYVVLGLSLVTVVMTFSRGGFVGMLVLAAFMVKNSRNKLASLVVIMTAGVVIYAAAPESWFERLHTIQDANSDSSFMGRVVAWKISWLIAAAHPLFGGGPHAVQHVFVWDTFRPLLPSLDFIETPPADVFPHAAHSIYFEILGDTGFVGLLLFLAAIGGAFMNCYRIMRLTRNIPSLVWAADLARMMHISLVIYLVTGAALSMGYFELVYVLLALTSRCHRTVRQALSNTRPIVSPSAFHDNEAMFVVRSISSSAS